MSACYWVLYYYIGMSIYTVRKFVWKEKQKTDMFGNWNTAPLHFLSLLPIAILIIAVLFNASKDGNRAITSCYGKWWAASSCGKHGLDCSPPSMSENNSENRTLNPRIKYKMLYCDRSWACHYPPVYGGGAKNEFLYAANSFLCPAGVHAGISMLKASQAAKIEQNTRL